MKKGSYLIALLLVVCLLSTAQAEVFTGKQPPEDWQNKETLRYMQIDTNRSDCGLLEVGGMSMLVDGGYAPFIEHVKRVLASRGLLKVDILLNSHPHDDHVVLTVDLLRQGFRAGVFMSPFEEGYNDYFQQSLVEQLKKADIPYYQLKDHDVITMGKATLTVRTLDTSDMNSRSAFVIVNYGSARLLLMGDLTLGPQKEFLVDPGVDAIKADVVKAPHHGLTYFDIDFINAVAPGAVVVPNKFSYDNQIGEQCIARRIPVYFSGDGDVVMETDGTDWYVYQLPHDNQ